LSGICEKTFFGRQRRAAADFLGPAARRRPKFTGAPPTQ